MYQTLPVGTRQERSLHLLRHKGGPCREVALEPTLQGGVGTIQTRKRQRCPGRSPEVRGHRLWEDGQVWGRPTRLPVSAPGPLTEGPVWPLCRVYCMWAGPSWRGWERGAQSPSSAHPLGSWLRKGPTGSVLGRGALCSPRPRGAREGCTVDSSWAGL